MMYPVETQMAVAGIADSLIGVPVLLHDIV